MRIRELMTIYPVSIQRNMDLRRAAEIISLADASDLMVIDEERNFVGVLSEGDLIRAILPNFDEVIQAGGTLQDAFMFFVAKGRELANRPIEPLIIKDPVTVSPDNEVAEVATILIQKQIRRLPVVQNGKLLGTVSRADVCRAVIYYA